MLAMATFSFNNEIEISECPRSLYCLKQKIKELYFLDRKQVNKIVISYKDSFDQQHYIFTEEQYKLIIPIIELIVLRIELPDEYNYLVIEPSFGEEYSNIYQLDFDKNNQAKDKSIHEICEKIENLNLETNEKEKKDKEINKKEIEIEIIHKGIKCNICDCESIRGIRYLCGICHNFNLCQKCEKMNGERHSHPLLKIRSPQYAPLFFKYELINKEEQ